MGIRGSNLDPCLKFMKIKDKVTFVINSLIFQSSIKNLRIFASTVQYWNYEKIIESFLPKHWAQ